MITIRKIKFNMGERDEEDNIECCGQGNISEGIVFYRNLTG